MPRYRKRFIHGAVYDITFRIEEGLPLVATPYMRLILESYLGRAQTKYQIKIVALVVMGNHIHLLMVVEDPSAVPDFLEYFKRETALAINRLLGRGRRTVWAEGYDSPIVLDAEKVIQRLVYFYTNPQRARLVNSIDEYPQLSTWRAFLSGGVVKLTVPTFPRTAIPLLKEDQQIQPDSRVILKSILQEKSGEVELVYEPFAWLACFSDTIDHPPQMVIEQVISQVRSMEHLLRKEKGENVLGAEMLKRQSFRRAHDPKKRGRRMICLGSCKIKRREYLGWFLDGARQASDAMRRWMEERKPLVMPPGFFAPGGMLFSNVFPQILLT